jgi:hypothetical protein
VHKKLQDTLAVKEANLQSGKIDEHKKVRARRLMMHSEEEKIKALHVEYSI